MASLWVSFSKCMKTWIIFVMSPENLSVCGEPVILRIMDGDINVENPSTSPVQDWRGLTRLGCPDQAVSASLCTLSSEYSPAWPDWLGWTRRQTSSTDLLSALVILNVWGENCHYCNHVSWTLPLKKSACGFLLSPFDWLEDCCFQKLCFRLQRTFWRDTVYLYIITHLLHYIQIKNQYVPTWLQHGDILFYIF